MCDKDTFPGRWKEGMVTVPIAAVLIGGGDFKNSARGGRGGGSESSLSDKNRVSLQDTEKRRKKRRKKTLVTSFTFLSLYERVYEEKRKIKFSGLEPCRRRGGKNKTEGRSFTRLCRFFEYGFILKNMPYLKAEKRMEEADKKPLLGWLLSAGIVGSDIGTSVFYSTGILFPIVGYMAPVFVLAVCLFMWVLKRVYEEGLAMAPYNGGAYSMILRSLGRRASVGAGALTFVSYLATAAVSSLSGSYYLCSLFSGDTDLNTVVLISFIPIIFFGLLNMKGIKEPAKLVTGVACFHFAFLIFLSVLGIGYIAFHFQEIDMGKFFQLMKWEGKNALPLIAYGFASAFLGITGFESAAQIIESMKKPHMETLRRLYKAVILCVSFTAPLISFCCLAVLTPAEVEESRHHLLSAFTFKIGGGFFKTLLVADAALMLFAAANTAFVGFIGLTVTMAKNGNLPQALLTRFYHKFPFLEGYPFITAPFILIAMGMSAFVAGEVEIAAKVYEIAFLGVMVSFALGAILLRNKGLKRSTPRKYLSKKALSFGKIILPLPALACGGALGFSVLILIRHAGPEALFMLTLLLAVTALLMAYYRWGVLESRLATHSDLRLGLGKFAYSALEDLPTDLKKHILCIGTANTRRLILATLNQIHRMEKGAPFELILFYAEDEDGGDSEIFYEQLQRVVSQQIAPIVKKDMILTVKILPGGLLEGLSSLKKTESFQSFYFGVGHDPIHAHKLKEEIARELEISIVSVH